ncbi:MAG: glycosyltransferase family protein [Christensenellaceae bacterium]
MKYLACIQARYGSSRLPGKILMDLQGKPVLQRVIERVEQSKKVDETIVITSANKDDLNTIKLVSNLGNRVMVGAQDDVLDRYYQTTRLLEPEYVIRITADCPVFDAQILDEALALLEADSDYMAAISETLADGLDLEIIKFSALKYAWEHARLASEREHVTLYIRNHPEIFKLQDFICPLGQIGNYRLTIDELEDYQLIHQIYEHFGDKMFFTQEILDFLAENPQLIEINKKFARNEGLKKSLENDYIVRR